MALYGSVVTDRGRALIAKLIAGQTLNISRVMVGKGQMASTATREDAAAMNDLITPVAQATTTIPTVTNGVAHFTVQFSSAMNGGLQTGFWLSELGVYAYDPDDFSSTGPSAATGSTSPNTPTGKPRTCGTLRSTSQSGTTSGSRWTSTAKRG